MAANSIKHLFAPAVAAVALLALGAAAVAGPKVDSWQTGGGAKVMYVHAPDLPMVDVRVVVDAGSARDGELAGLARFTSAMLSEGAGDWDADTLAERLESRGIELGSSSLRDMAWVSVRSLVEPDVLDVALDTLRTVLAAPRFDAAAIERVRQQMQIGLRRALQSPGSVAQRRFYRTLYAGHPYAHPPGGEQASLAAIGVDDLRRFHATHYVAANAVVAIVGAVDRAAAERIAEQVTGGLAVGQKAPPLPPVPTASGAELRESFPSSQTHIYVGQAGMSRHDPDYYPLYVGNHVLGGGGLVSTLGDEVREKRGLSYSVYSYFSPMRVDGPFLMVAQTKNEQADKALQVMRETLQRFVEQGPGDKELEDAKQNLIGGFPLRIASNGKIVEYLAMMGFYDYPLDHLDTLPGKLAAVTAEQVRDAFSRRIVDAAGIAVIVGGAATGDDSSG
ncbi:MAG: pitrilysin family protein [Gammaproteobacteria bacterium]|nr:pitrilysin family protein [Gammaproteobacteria bacterium]